MKIDVYSATGAKKGSLDLPATLFEAAINQGLMHQAVVMQQSNRRRPIAHAKNRGEVIGSTKKMFAQKGTGRARRGPLRSPLLRGGGKAFGPRSNRNYHKDMPKTMRRVAFCAQCSGKERFDHGTRKLPRDREDEGSCYMSRENARGTRSQDSHRHAVPSSRYRAFHEEHSECACDLCCIPQPRRRSRRTPYHFLCGCDCRGREDLRWGERPDGEGSKIAGCRCSR